MKLKQFIAMLAEEQQNAIISVSRTPCYFTVGYSPKEKAITLIPHLEPIKAPANIAMLNFHHLNHFTEHLNVGTLHYYLSENFASDLDVLVDHKSLTGFTLLPAEEQTLFNLET